MLHDFSVFNCISFPHLATGTVDALTLPATTAFIIIIFTRANKVRTSISFTLTRFLHKLEKIVIVKLGGVAILAKSCCVVEVHFGMWWLLLQKPGLARENQFFSIQYCDDFVLL